MSSRNPVIYSNRPLPIISTRKAPEWATFIEGRDPEFKMHTTLGHAKNAISGSGHGILYRWMDVTWTPVAIADSGTTNPLLKAGFIPTEQVFTYTIQEEP